MLLLWDVTAGICVTPTVYADILVIVIRPFQALQWARQELLNLKKGSLNKSILRNSFEGCNQLIFCSTKFHNLDRPFKNLWFVLALDCLNCSSYERFQKQFDDFYNKIFQWLCSSMIKTLRALTKTNIWILRDTREAKKETYNDSMLILWNFKWGSVCCRI